MNNIEKAIRANINGIESLTYEKGENYYDVVTKNVFISLSRLTRVKELVGAKEIEVNIVYMTNRLAYRIFF